MIFIFIFIYGKKKKKLVKWKKKTMKMKIKKIIIWAIIQTSHAQLYKKGLNHLIISNIS